MPDAISEYMPDRMSDRMPEEMPDRMSEDIKDRMPERKICNARRYDARYNIRRHARWNAR